MEFLLFPLIAAGAYLMGGANGAIICSRLVYKDDVRLHGSKNAGLTNFWRTYGKQSVFLLILIDVLKTAIPVLLGGMFLVNYASFLQTEDRLMIGRTFAGFFAMLGHSYPVYYGFKGGKAVLAGGTVAIFIDYRVALFVWGLFFLALLLTRYVSLGSVLAGLAFPIAFAFFGFHPIALGLSAACGLFIVYRHHGNIARLLKGEERKVGSKGKKPPNQEGNTGGDA